MGQLLEIVNNIDSLVIKGCNQEQEKVYRNAIKNTFIRLDAYYEKTGLYKYRDFEFFVNEMLDGTHYFNLSMEELTDWAGLCERSRAYGQHTAITIPIAFLQEGTMLEGILDHELGHMQTIGTGAIVYKDEHGRTINNFTGVSNYKLVIDGEDRKVEPITVTFTNRVISEGNTELFKQTRYSVKECYYTYPLETRLVGLLNELCTDDEIEWQKEYLQGEMNSYVEFFNGDTNKFLSLLEQADDNGEFYLGRERPICNECIDYIIRAYCKNLQVGKEHFNVESIIRKGTKILTFFQDEPEKFNAYKNLFKTALDARIQMEAKARAMSGEQVSNLTRYITESISLGYQRDIGVPVSVNIALQKQGDQLLIKLANSRCRMLVPFANKNLTCCSSQDDDRKIEIEKKSNEVYIVKVMEKKQDKSGQKDFKEVEKFAVAVNTKNIDNVKVKKGLLFITEVSKNYNLATYFDDKKKDIQKKYGIKQKNQVSNMSMNKEQ